LSEALGITFEEIDRAGVVTLDRPTRLNALTREMFEALSEHYRRWAPAPHIYGVVVQSSHPSVFSSGGDLKLLQEWSEQGALGAIREFYRAAYRHVWVLEKFIRPNLPLINGLCLGGGIGISLYGTHCVAGEGYRFGIPQVGIGFLPDIGGTYFLPRMLGRTGLYLALTGRLIGPAEAYRHRLVLAVVLVAAFGCFVWRGLDQVEALRTAHAELASRRVALAALQRSVDLVPYDEFAALTRRRADAVALVERRRQVLADDAVAAPRPDLETLLTGSTLPALRAPSLLAEALRKQAARSPEAEAALVAVLGALPAGGGVDLETLELAGEGRPQPLADAPELREIRAQVVLTGAPADVLACLEAFAVDRGRGLPAPSVLTASLRRIEPERWGSGLHRLAAPPVRLSVSLAVLLPWPVSVGS
jgi:enoyl-CoA hydratase/carnithine racemase